MDWKLYSFVARGKNREAVVIELLKSPRLPKDIAEKTKISISHISRSLTELEVEGIVECLTPNEKRGRVYELTPKGKEIAEKLLVEKK